MVEQNLRERTMDIKKYAGYFHDGGLIDIKHIADKIELFITSAEMDPEDLEDDIPLDNWDCLKGILHLENVKNVLTVQIPLVRRDI